MTAVSLIITLSLSFVLICINKRFVPSVFIWAMCFIPATQAIDISGLDLKALRILGILAVIRIFAKNEYHAYRWNTFDIVFILWTLVGLLTYVLLWQSSAAFIYRLGILIDSLLIYFVFRNYIKDSSCIERLFRAMAYTILFLTPFVLIEHSLGKNPFSIMGKELVSIREGRVRCNAAFDHAILLGSYSASLLPITLTLRHAARGRERLIFTVACLSSIYITIASASSGPLLALVAGALPWCAFSYRKYLGVAAWGFIGVSVFLHIFMEAPVWHLISRIDVVGGSTGYHRYFLIDQTIKNFPEWAMVGVKSVAHWGVHAGDVTSMYIAQGVSGGFLTMIMFLWLVFYSIRVYWKASIDRKNREISMVLWALVCYSISHAVSFISVAYFGQIYMLIPLGICIAAILNKKKGIKSF